MDAPEYIFQTTDYRGKNIVFTKAKWEEKHFRHPELNKTAFLKCIERALAEPDEVWEDYEIDRIKETKYFDLKRVR
jgi:hypothetical protein